MPQPANLNITNPSEAAADFSSDDFGLEVESAVSALASSHSGPNRPSYAVVGMAWYDTDDGILKLWNGTVDREILIRVAVPATATSTGFVGQIAYDATHFYVCTATNVWRRVAIATW